MNRPRYKEMYLHQKEKIKLYKNGIEGILEAIEQLDIKVLNNETFRPETMFGYARKILLANEEKNKCRAICFYIGEEDD